MSKKITIQENHQALQTSSEVLILDVQSDSQPTQPLLHKQSRFLYILEGEGKIKIEDNVYELHPNTVISVILLYEKIIRSDFNGSKFKR